MEKDKATPQSRTMILMAIRACLHHGCAQCPFRDVFTCKVRLLEGCLRELEGAEGN